MDKAMLLNHLEQARRHVALGIRHVERQRALIGELERKGHDSGEAVLLLRQFEDMLRLHVEDCERIEKELAET